jgi:hypothetical protein
VVWISERWGIEDGKEELVMATLLYGYYQTSSAIALRSNKGKNEAEEVDRTYIRIDSSPPKQLLNIRR